MYEPLTLDTGKPMFFMKYKDWWNEIIFDDKQNFYTRRDIILFITNKDGGTHVDPTLNESYAALTRHNSLGWVDSSGRPSKNNPAYVAIRQIAYEVLASQKLFLLGTFTRKKLPQSIFEMRFVDESKRFKWSTTDYTYSNETFAIVSQYRKEKRQVYKNEYKNGRMVRIIW